MHRLVFILICSLSMAVPQAWASGCHLLSLDEGWTFKQARLNNWHPATVPGCVHTDLINNGMLSDPFYGMNERGAQWIDKEDWEYGTTFHLTADDIASNNQRLTFYGLDTFADVYLNDQLILEADNMFRTWIVDVKGKVHTGSNALRIYFHSPIKKGIPMHDAVPYHYEATNDQAQNGGLFDKQVSVFMRKAGFHFGWDWGPRLVTSGIWRPVVFSAWNDLRIEDVYISQPSVTSRLARLHHQVEVLSDTETKATVTLRDKSTGKVFFAREVTMHAGLNTIDTDFEVKNPRLWWTNGLGEHYLYNMETVVSRKNDISDSMMRRVGIRSLRVLNERDEIGRELCFELNGHRVFMKGANYIPCDNFQSRVNDSIYHLTIDAAVSSNMNMLRVWGGGIYEDERFYELCDEQGMLVWQDFMFACGLFPGRGAYLESVRQEAIDNVRRLRNHASIAIWAGNNECQDVWFNWGSKEKLDRAGEGYAARVWQEYQNIFYDVLPSVVKKYNPETLYWPSSPFGDYGHGSNTTEGDYHYWGVWHANEPISNYNTVRSRFFSEYGIQSFPELATVRSFAPDRKDWDIYGDVMMSHQRGGTFANGRIEGYLKSEYREPKDFEELLYLGQLMQGDAMKTATEAHRRDKGYCWGTLVWQINDCWPVASWSTRDYYGRWKAAQYMMRQAFRDILVSPIEKDGMLRIQIVNDRLTKVKGTLTVKVLTLTGELVSEKHLKLTIPANSSFTALHSPLSSLLNSHDRRDVVVRAELQTAGDLYTNNYFLLKPKDINWPSANVKCEHRTIDGGKIEVRLSSDVFARGVYIAVDDDAICDYSDNYIDLLPGEQRTIIIAPRSMVKTPFNPTITIRHL